jgi:RecB family exonuclease
LFKDTKGLCIYVNAGHNRPLFYRAESGDIVELATTGPVLGPSPEQEYFYETVRTIDRIRSEADWAPKKSALCDWCEYRTYCPAFGGTRPAPTTAQTPSEAGGDVEQLALL